MNTNQSIINSKHIILIHYGEIGLKGKNQVDFINQLKENIQLKLQSLGLNWLVKVKYGYLLISLSFRAEQSVAEESPANAGIIPDKQGDLSTRPDKLGLGRDDNIKKILDSLKEIFGIAWYAQTQELGIMNYESGTTEIEENIIQLAKKQYEPNKTFAVRVNRVDKNFPLTSHELEVKIGKTIQDKTKWKEVDLNEPDQTFYVDIYPPRLSSRASEANREISELVSGPEPAYIGDSSTPLEMTNIIYIYTKKIKGLGGLPVGTAGKVLTLLSGGIDSPVAGYLMAKRGAQVDFLHFAANNIQIKEAQNYLISKITKQLSKYTLHSKLFIVPYTYFNLAIMDKKISHELIIFRRFMVRAAERLAKQLNNPRHPGVSEASDRISLKPRDSIAPPLSGLQNDRSFQAIVTGDNLAQVASQTLPNLISTSKAVDMPIFRPLISYDKNEIIELAKKINTYELSIQPYKDCCSIISRHAKTRSNYVDLEKQEKEILPNYQELINQTLNDIVVLEFKNGKQIN